MAFKIKNKEGNIMSKKNVSLFTLIAFIVFSLSCYTIREKKVKTVSDWEGKEVTIMGVQKTSGEYIEFQKDSPGRIYKDTIIGKAKKKFEIARANVKKTGIDTEGEIAEITTKDGKVYPIISSKITEDKIILEAYESISIPLSEVELVWVKKAGPAGIAIAIIGVVAVVGLIDSISKSEPRPTTSGNSSCPFIYSFDGEKYIFDAEPYGGAICQGLKRTEWCGLENLKEINGQYKILVLNELNETQYTDELKLVIVDHPKGVKVVPDASGKIYTVSQPITPTQAYDQKGRDLLPSISENDWKFWVARTEEKNPERKEDLRDELIFEFPKPEGATKAKLLFNGGNTLWGSQALKLYLDLYGNKVSEWYEEINNFGPAFFRMVNMHVKEELYSLKIRVEAEDGWKSKALIIGGGPFISEEKIYALDISDVTGDTLRIKLTPPAAFWIINHIAVDYTEDLPITVTEIGVVETGDYKEQEVRETLTLEDNNYLVMPDIGDRAALTFRSPPQSYGMDRSVFVKASGYYDIHLKSEGEPQLELLYKLHTEPGFVVQHAFKEYLRWKKENMEIIKQK